MFVWGLNDKDQLGGPKGSKVRFRPDGVMSADKFAILESVKLALN